MADISHTQYFEVKKDNEIGASETIRLVYEALKQKGYNPINQIVGYIMSGDPSYITSYNNARRLICRIERDELVEELLNAYIDGEAWNR